ncbi:GntR family transcriptional regulator [Nesterenkonia ebinurensis]|uniref:GntR family transcriptional regulator n=1 Tax=Nesterenkonia ebinurensis TaxID=2608252 RepID=UPI001CC475BD|nr:GntR family transcriptional regulator [Nesterenkonia ebinurensis]
MILRVDPAAPAAPYEQLRDQLVEQIRSGALKPGTTLLPVRRLAGDLRVAPNTVARTYRELEHAGYVKGQGRRGTVVLGPPTRQGTDDAAELTRDYLQAMASHGFTREQTVSYLKQAAGRS